MKEKGKQKTLRLAQEHCGQAEDIARVERRASTWKRRPAFLGLALMVNVGLVIPFSDGHSLHSHFRTAGKALVFVLSTASNASIEEAAAASKGDLWFRLYIGSAQAREKIKSRWPIFRSSHEKDSHGQFGRTASAKYSKRDR